jgi:restriction endonuclease S subunit
MQYSIVNFKQLDQSVSFRFDAEFFHPRALLFEKRINGLHSKTIKEYGCTVVSGPFGSSLKSDSYLKYGIPFIRISDLRDFIIDTNEMTYISQENHARLYSSKLNIGDLVLSKVGNTIGIVSIVTPDIGECNISENNIGIRFPKECPIEDRKFILAFLNSDAGQIQILRSISGNAQPKLNVSDVELIRVPIVASSLIKTISNIIDQAIALIGKSKQCYSQAEQLLLSELGLAEWKPKHRLSFVKNFSDTATAGRIDAEYFQPMYEEVVKAIESSKSRAALGDIVSIKKCIEPGSEAYKDSGIPFLRVSNLSKFGINNDNQQFISETLYDTLKTHQPKKGEILLSKDATPGIAYYLKDTPEKMIPSGGILRLTIKDINQIHPEYLTLVLNSVIVQKQIERDAGGSIINHWLVDQVKNTLIPILPISTQKSISDKINQSFSDREQSKRLLDIAKRGVEMAIEKDEQEAEKWIQSEIDKIEIE